MNDDFYEPRARTPRSVRTPRSARTPRSSRTPRKRRWFGVFNHGTRSRLKRCMGTAPKNVYSLPIDIMNLKFRKLPNNDFEVLPADSSGRNFEDTLGLLYHHSSTNPTNHSYKVDSKVDNNWMSRCVRNRFVLPRNFLSSDHKEHDRTVPYYEKQGDRLVFHVLPPVGKSRVPLRQFMDEYGHHVTQYFGGVR
jgi:hypothetical protein